ncbi:MAG: hypothetical protein C5B55_14430 [Blastocatellia bacterium]|nr:MAG: hypothetical protein C5B55_14430 [Blastocatellia bacterium]
MRVFVGRVVRSVFVAVLMSLAAVSVGTVGYHGFAQLGWTDSFLEASMILSGMGPVNPLKSDAAKIFASIYALFSGLFFIAIMGVLLAPLMHRLMHKFHLESKKDSQS